MESALLARGLRLEYATLAWNVVGTAVVIAAAISARSVALAGFGIDSLIEIFASLVVVWQLKGVHRHRERRALRMIGGAFVGLALYVLVQASYTLVRQVHPEPLLAGLVWLIATVAAMLLLAWGKSVTGTKLGNQVLITEARVTLIDAYLAAAVFVGGRPQFTLWMVVGRSGGCARHCLLRHKGRLACMAPPAPTTSTNANNHPTRSLS